MTQADAEKLASHIAVVLERIETGPWSGMPYTQETIRAELEHILRREAVARGPKVTP